MNNVFLLLWLLSAPFVVTGILCNARFSDFFDEFGHWALWITRAGTWQAALADLLLKATGLAVAFAIFAAPLL